MAAATLASQPSTVPGLSGIAKVWRDTLKNKVKASITQLDTVHASIKKEAGQVNSTRAQYFQQQLDDARKLVEHDIPAGVTKIEDKVREAFNKKEYAELLSFEDKLRSWTLSP